MNPVGIMLGRLSQPSLDAVQRFPSTTWRDEFALAKQCGFDRIEWLVADDHLTDNPIWSEAGRAEIRARAAAAEIVVRTLNAHWLIASPLVRVDAAARSRSIALLESLLRCCADAAIDTIVVPLLEAGEVRTAVDAAAVCDALCELSELGRSLGVGLAVESDAPTAQYLNLLESLPAPVGACYDVGNMTARAYDVPHGLRELGRHLVNVHIKDRRHHGPSVRLGEGDVDFAGVFDALTAIGYDGPLILETPAGRHPVDQAQRHLQFVRDWLSAGARNGVPH